MPRHFAAAMRRAAKLMRSLRPKKRAPPLQTSLTRWMVTAAASSAAKPAVRQRARAKTAGSLGAVVTRLQGEATPQKRASRATAKPPALATHTAAGVSRRYQLYMPKTAIRPTGLLLMLHGCNQTVDDFALGTDMNRHADRHGLIVVYAAQTAAHNPAACWNWFRPGHQARGGGEPALLASLIRKLTREHGLARDQVYVAGLSAGGAMAAILADVYPDVFAAAGIHSGLARGAARDVLSAMSAMRSGGTPSGIAPMHPGHVTRRIIFHGDKDGTVHPSNALSLVAGAIGDTAQPQHVTRRRVRGRDYAKSSFTGPGGQVDLELWTVQGTGHAWSGGKAAGSYTDADGPDASALMIRFFLAASA